MRLKISAYPCSERIVPQIIFYHPKYVAALGVAYGIKQLLYFPHVLHVRLNGMRCLERVIVQCPYGFKAHEILPHLPFWKDVIYGLVRHERGKALVKPEVVPPFHGHEVAGPLVPELVRDYHGYELFR